MNLGDLKPIAEMTLEEKTAELAFYFMDDRDQPSVLLEESCIEMAQISSQTVAAAEALIVDDINKTDDDAVVDIMPIYQKAIIKDMSVKEIDDILMIIRNPAVCKLEEIMNSAQKENEQLIHDIFDKHFKKNDLTNKFVKALEQVASLDNTQKTKPN